MADPKESSLFTKEEYERLAQALVGGSGGKVSDFQIQQFILWAERVAADTMILDMILDGTLDVCEVKHMVQEGCDFDVKIVGDIEGVDDLEV